MSGEICFLTSHAQPHRNITMASETIRQVDEDEDQDQDEAEG